MLRFLIVWNGDDSHPPVDDGRRRGDHPGGNLNMNAEKCKNGDKCGMHNVDKGFFGQGLSSIGMEITAAVVI